MSGLWGLIDGLIAWFALLGGRQTPSQLLTVLRFNAGLDVLYLVAAGVLLTRRRPPCVASGWACSCRGVLLLFDGYFWWRWPG